MHRGLIHTALLIWTILKYRFPTSRSQDSQCTMRLAIFVGKHFATIFCLHLAKWRTHSVNINQWLSGYVALRWTVNQSDIFVTRNILDTAKTADISTKQSQMRWFSFLFSLYLQFRTVQINITVTLVRMQGDMLLCIQTKLFILFANKTLNFQNSYIVLYWRHWTHCTHIWFLQIPNRCQNIEI